MSLGNHTLQDASFLTSLEFLRSLRTKLQLVAFRFDFVDDGDFISDNVDLFGNRFRVRPFGPDVALRQNLLPARDCGP